MAQSMSTKLCNDLLTVGSLKAIFNAAAFTELRIYSGVVPTGANEAAGKVSLYRGPLLYAYDARYNELNPDHLPALDWASVQFEDATWDGPIEPWALAALKDAKGATYRVCDFSSAGQTGNQYKSWLP